MTLACLLGAARAEAISCGATVSARFTAAAALCGASAAVPSAAPVPIQGAGPVRTAPPPSSFVQEIQPVSVTMAPSRVRLQRASRAVRAYGPAPTNGLIVRVARRYRIDPPLLASIVRAESGGRVDAVSRVGALGLMQVMPGTARSMGVREPRALLSDPALALSTGALYLKTLQARFGNRPDLVVAAYNAGPGAVERAGLRVPHYSETRTYVSRVMGSYSGTSRARTWPARTSARTGIRHGG